ncbi:two component transcriptional regulator, LytTR family [Reichenbachiella faecimaris]|uniref:Two component transcriptional regulator, LytTR family n=1 Tax=Reichenbachiella faecimaris TaxID=692418 RepID=A0A1W2GC35_REIFA|nr:LytTR family DNA-binding domain-containing protein [Reichenbachiella faecimaris]SMD34074.1 two component transcriptional regulator, LytTR family [Reichenbachiella faecimaris]
MHCLIVDDDPLICDLLEHFCSKVDFVSNVTVTNSGFESINLISQNQFDVILLDYNLPDITGKEILQTVGLGTFVIMITANRDFASESYDYEQIVDFLVKPIDFARFFKGMQKVQKQSHPSTHDTDQIFVKDGNKLVKVDLKQVKYIKSAANYAELVFEERKLLTLMTLTELAEKLPNYFQRVQRSYIVNVNHIDSIASGDVQVGQEEISISDLYEKELLNKIKLLK